MIMNSVYDNCNYYKAYRNCLISFKSSKGSIIYLSPYSFQSLSLIISITANISDINKQSQKLTLCADKAKITDKHTDLP